jgi:hypothetical protein
LALPADPIVGAAQLHAVLVGWRRTLHGDGAPVRSPETVA